MLQTQAMNTSRAVRWVSRMVLGAWVISVSTAQVVERIPTRPALTRQVPAEAGSSNAPLLFCVGMHIEPLGATPSSLVETARTAPRPGPSYELPGLFRRHLADIRQVADIVEKHGGRVTIQAQTPFTRVAAESGEKGLADLGQRGHEIALHFHEDAHLGRGSERLPEATWTAVMREEMEWLRKAGAPRIRYWSGGNLYPGLLEAATRAGLDVMSDYKNPRRQESDPRLLAVNPWRPAGGPSEGDLSAFVRHDPEGKIIYLPDGIFSRIDHAGMRRSAELGGDWGYFDFLTEGLELSLRAARADRVNVFHFTIHAGEFRGGPGEPFAVIEAWLREVLDPLVKAGKVRWATFSEMAEEYVRWEKAHAGVDPRGSSTRGSPEAASTVEPRAKSGSGSAKEGSMTFAVNVHDWRFVNDSADTVLRLIGIFERHRVRGDFYLTAPVVERYVAERPEVVQRLKGSGMTISYHVRAPHPLWRGFSGPLGDESDEEIRAALRDYETYQLDLKTGGLNREKPGGYRYVEQIFGRKPVAVGTSDAVPRVKALSSGVYAALGAQVGVFYHETGTRPDRPFEWRDGLLVRPSDFSITRFQTGRGALGGSGVFWWNMQGTARAAEFDPVERLKKELAAWKGGRPPYVTALIHENDFYREGGPGWNSIYFEGQGPQSRPRRAPFDLERPPSGSARSAAVREAIFTKYEELVACAAERLEVVTSEDIAARARKDGVNFGAEATLGRSPPPGPRPDEPSTMFAGEPGRRPDAGGGVANRPGPWDNDVLVYRMGTNGASEKLATFERAGVPTLARLEDGRFIAAFQHFPKDDSRNFDRVAVRFSGDEGRTWTVPEPIVVDGMELGLARPFDPTLVPLPDGRIRLYFTSNRSADFRRSAPAIYSAVSTNGIHYAFEPGVRFGLEGRIVIDCAATLHKGVFHLIVPDNGTVADFAAGPARGQPPRGGTGYHAVSSDGLKFERVADVELPGNRRWLGNMQSDGGQVVFFGTGDPGLWSATSRAGEEWELSAIPLRVAGADPGAVRLRDGGWLLAVTGPPRPGTASVTARFGGREAPPATGRRIFTRIPSSAGGAQGIAVGLLVPERARYTNGAPVAIDVPGGVQSGSAAGRPEYVGLGFAEIHFAFPGGGEGGERSGGRYDFRGPNCIRALADVIRFATGRIADQEGRRINELAGGIAVLTNNCGIIGSSHGGNACGLAMALHGEEFPDLPWYASMESPYGEGAANVELGGHESGMNPAYNPKTGRLDLSRLAWSAGLSPGLFRKQMPVPTRDFKGAFFFDLDGDGRFSADKDFPANCFVGDDGQGVRAWYSPRILEEADRRHLVPDPPPRHIPSVGESREFWRYRDAAGSIPGAVRNCTNLAVIVYANERDHVQAAPDHGHILIQVEGFRLAKARFVRLNPDRSYVEQLLESRPGLRQGFRPGAEPPTARTGFPDNSAGAAFDRGNIVTGVEPARFPVGLYMQAAVSELADRTQAQEWAANLDGVLFPGAPRQGFRGGVGPRPDSR